MAKIKNSNPKATSGSYERLVGNTEMAIIFTKAQSTVIRNGNELEKIISKKSQCIDDLDLFIDECDKCAIKEGSYLCTKSTVKKSKYKLDHHEPDFIAFKVSKTNNLCYVVELKDGDNFDTKKSLAEREMLQLFVNHLAPKIPFRAKFYICAFNQLDKDKIVTGFKQVFTEDEVMTGREFCDILGISYDDIVKDRQDDSSDNFQYVVEKMFAIKKVRTQFNDNYRKHIDERNFYITDDLLDGGKET